MATLTLALVLLAPVGGLAESERPTPGVEVRRAGTAPERAFCLALHDSMVRAQTYIWLRWVPMSRGVWTDASIAEPKGSAEPTVEVWKSWKRPVVIRVSLCSSRSVTSEECGSPVNMTIGQSSGQLLVDRIALGSVFTAESNLHPEGCDAYDYDVDVTFDPSGVKDVAALPLVVAAMADKDGKARTLAAEALGAMAEGSVPAVKALEAARDDPDRRVRHAVEVALANFKRNPR